MTDYQRIERPVFVIGTGRSGLSPLMDLIAYHRDFAWPSRYNNTFCKHLWMSAFSRLLDIPLLNSRWKFRLAPYVPRHTESYRLWTSLFYGFGRPIRDLGSGDVTPLVRANFHKAIGTILRYQGKPRFITELSGWSRIGFLKEIFPDAQFIHIVRDGRAVANSLIHVDWWLGWQGVYKWHLDVPDSELMRLWEKHDRSFLTLAGIYWQLLINNILEKSAQLESKNILVVRYEDLVKDPRQKAKECIEFAGLDANCRRFDKHLTTLSIVDANQTNMRIPSWRRNLTAEQIEMLDELLGKELRYFGYL